MSQALQKFLATLLLLLFASLRTASASAEEDIAAGNQAYRAENFTAAVAHYQSAIDSGARNAALFYNLGNASFRAGELGQAILSYERALVLKPQHPEARANLHLAQDKARALELGPMWWDQFTARVTPRQLLLFGTVTFWVAVFFLLAWWLAARGSVLRLLGGVLALGLSGASLAALYATETGRRGCDLAIVTGEKVEARVATADSASAVLALPAGSEIKILSTRGDWIYAALPNDLRGWLPAGSAERVRL